MDKVARLNTMFQKNYSIAFSILFVRDRQNLSFRCRSPDSTTEGETLVPSARLSATVLFSMTRSCISKIVVQGRYRIHFTGLVIVEEVNWGQSEYC